MVVMVDIRAIREADAGAYMALLLQVDAETPNMKYEAGERAPTEVFMRSRIAEILGADNRMIFVAESDDSLVGFLGAYGKQPRRVRHCVSIVVGVLRSHWRQGIAAQLFEELDAWARAGPVHRLELTVQVHNETAVRLYRRMGFEIEGTLRDSVRLDGVSVDQYTMAKLL